MQERYRATPGTLCFVPFVFSMEFCKSVRTNDKEARSARRLSPLATPNQGARRQHPPSYQSARSQSPPLATPNQGARSHLPSHLPSHQSSHQSRSPSSRPSSHQSSRQLNQRSSHHGRMPGDNEEGEGTVPMGITHEQILAQDPPHSNQ